MNYLIDTNVIAKVREHDAAKQKSPWRKQSEEPAPEDVLVLSRGPDRHTLVVRGEYVDQDDEWMHIPE